MTRPDFDLHCRTDWGVKFAALQLTEPAHIGGRLRKGCAIVRRERQAREKGDRDELCQSDGARGGEQRGAGSDPSVHRDLFELGALG